MQPAVHNILWTSGWDSTYRVMKLLLASDVIIQPWYVSDLERRSTKMELRALSRIRAAVIALEPSSEARLKPVKMWQRDRIASDAAVTTAYKRLASRSHLGTQYDWLARLAREASTTLELSIHKDDSAHVFLVEHVEDQGNGVYALRAGDEDKDLELVFGSFTFPVFEVTKVEMEEDAKRLGFSHIMYMTWFCHSPLFGRPCGVCNPCRYTREEGLGSRVPDASAVRKLIVKVARRIHRYRRRLAPTKK